MFCDTHCHPFDLLNHLAKDDLEACLKDTAWAASAWNLEQFEFHQDLKKTTAARGGPPAFLCFAVHPQLPALPPGPDFPSPSFRSTPRYIKSVLLPLLERLAAEHRLAAVGETGFDLFDNQFKKTESIQDEIFTLHLEIALKHDLPLVLHVRRAMHKVFFHAKSLRGLPAVVFHSWPGTVSEGEALLRRGINAYFSFGTAIVNNHKEARRSCALFPQERILLETDAPYLPLRGRGFSSWADMPMICQSAAELRKEAGVPGGIRFEELETLTMANFFRVFQNKEALRGT